MECSIVRDLKRSAGAGMISKKVSYILPSFLGQGATFGFKSFCEFKYSTIVG